VVVVIVFRTFNGYVIKLSLAPVYTAKTVGNERYTAQNLITLKVNNNE
jgi:hypothetical protein